MSRNGFNLPRPVTFLHPFFAVIHGNRFRFVLIAAAARENAAFARLDVVHIRGKIPFEHCLCLSSGDWPPRLGDLICLPPAPFRKDIFGDRELLFSPTAHRGFKTPVFVQDPQKRGVSPMASIPPPTVRQFGDRTPDFEGDTVLYLVYPVAVRGCNEPADADGILPLTSHKLAGVLFRLPNIHAVSSVPRALTSPAGSLDYVLIIA